MLENHITQEIEAANKRAIIFAGPVLSEDDPEVDYGYGSIKYPLKFWKIVVAVSTDNKDSLETYGFVLDQSPQAGERGFEKMDFSDFEIHQKSLTHITEISGVTFDAQLAEADVLRGDDSEGDQSLGKERAQARIEKLSDVKLHGIG